MKNRANAIRPYPIHPFQFAPFPFIAIKYMQYKTQNKNIYYYIYNRLRQSIVKRFVETK